MVNNNDYERKPDNRSQDVSEIFESSGNCFSSEFLLCWSMRGYTKRISKQKINFNDSKSVAFLMLTLIIQKIPNFHWKFFGEDTCTKTSWSSQTEKSFWTSFYSDSEFLSSISGQIWPALSWVFEIPYSRIWGPWLAMNLSKLSQLTKFWMVPSTWCGLLSRAHVASPRRFRLCCPLTKLVPAELNAFIAER